MAIREKGGYLRSSHDEIMAYKRNVEIFFDQRWLLFYKTSTEELNGVVCLRDQSHCTFNGGESVTHVVDEYMLLTRPDKSV